MKRITCFILAAVMVVGLAGAQTAGREASGYDPADLVEGIAADHILVLDLSAGSLAVDGGSPIAIGQKASPSSWGLSAVRTAYGITLTSGAGTAVRCVVKGALSGTLSFGGDAVYVLELDGASVVADKGPALNLQTKRTTYLVLAAGSSNRLADGPGRVKELDEKAALSAKGRLVISGSGGLSVEGNYKHGIYSKEYLRVRSGTIDLKVTARDGIRTDQGFYFDGGNLNIVGTGSAVDEESKGIKVDGTEKAPGKGGIVINGGAISIRTVGKGITAAWEPEDASTPEAADDPDPDVVVNGGCIAVTTTGKPYKRKDASGKTVSLSPEGIEAKSDLIIHGGEIVVDTADDCLNAGASILIDGGRIWAKSSANDAIDSNGTLTIAGGVVVAQGTGGPEGAFDCDANRFAVTGGIFIGFGGTTSGPTAEACSQNLLVAGRYAAGELVAIKDQAGKTIFAFRAPAALPTTVLSAPALATGVEYSIYTGCALVSGEDFHGLFLGDLNAEGGTAAATFTPTGPVTKIGGMIFGPPPAGAFPGGPPPEGGFPPPEGMGPPPDGAPPDGWTPPALDAQG